MKYKTLGLFYLLVVTMVLAGCRTSPIYNVSEAPFPENNGTEKQIASAIVNAGSSLGWIMKKKEPGHIVGTLYLRSHIAIVDVHYTNETYSITYNDSTNLKYDGEVIHSNYNGWIQNLSNAIRTQVALAGA